MEEGVFRGKKGLAPVIASVLLILFVFVLATLIFLWARGFISEQIEKFGQPVDVLCSQVQFDVEIIEGELGQEALEVVNRGDIDIYRLEVKLFHRGTSIFRKFEYNIDSGQSARGDIILDMENGLKPSKITVYPALIGNLKGKDSNKVFTCLEQGKELRVQ